jgi:hypothetical protein
MNRLLCKLLLGLSTLVLASTAPAQIPSAFFGMHEHRLLDQNEPWPTGAGTNFVGTMRTWDMETLTGWFEIEHIRGTYDFSNLDHLISLAQTNGADVTYTFGWTPQWAIGSAPCINANGGYTGSPSPGCAMAPASLTYWDEFVTALATHAKGKIAIYELWNEPNTINSAGVGMFWNGQSCNGSSCTFQQQSSLSTLVTMAQHAKSIINSIDPAARIATPSPSTGDCSSGSYVHPYCWMNDYLVAGGGAYADVIAFHGYPGANPQPENITPIIGEIRNTMSNRGVSTKGLIDTESSYCNASVPDPVAFTARWEILHASPQNTDRNYWYAWDDSACGQLWSSSSGLLATGLAFSQVSSWLTGSRILQACSVTNNLYTCGLTLANGQAALIAWNTSGSTSFSPGSTYKQFKDLSGNTTNLSGAVTVGVRPLLLIGSSPSLTTPGGLTAIVQ